MSDFETKRLPVAPTEIAPDKSAVRPLLRLARGSMAHFELAPGTTSDAVTLPENEEIWFFLMGRGQMWRKLGDHDEVVPVEPGVCITIPAGTHFQFRSFGYEALAAVGVTMPPWTKDTICPLVEGKWAPTAAQNPK